MDYIVSSEELGSIVVGLKSPIRRKSPHFGEECLVRVAENGYANTPDIEDIIHFCDDRISKLLYTMPIERWCELFSLPVRSYFDRPRMRQQSASGSKGISAADLALLLIRFEQIGYSIDPRPIISALTDSLNGQLFVTESELEILWYESTRHKCAPVTFSVDRNDMGIGRKEEKLTTETGYKAEMIWDDEEIPILLTVKAAKYRSRPQPVRTLCDICGWEWYRGDPESSATHRKEHARRLKYLDPQPNPRFSEMTQGDHHLCLVTTTSRQWMHKEIFLRALAFRRELKYDFIQWESPNGDADPLVHGYLFVNPDCVVVGACAFRWRGHEERFFWGLQWVWISPAYRRSGILTNHWFALRGRHGNFLVESPVSAEMMVFLEKCGDEKLTRLDIVCEGAAKKAIPAQIR